MPYLTGLLSGELGLVVRLSRSRRWKLETAFRDSVLHIIPTSPDEEMIGIDTWRVIALVAHVPSLLRPHTRIKEPRHNGRWPQPLRVTLVYQDVSVTVMILRRRPRPTAISLMDFRPEP